MSDGVRVKAESLPDAPGNVLMLAAASGLPKDSVANTSQIVIVDQAFLAKRVGKLSPNRLEQVMTGIDVVLGR